MIGLHHWLGHSIRIHNDPYLPRDRARFVSTSSIAAHPDMIERMRDGINLAVVDQNGRVFVCDQAVGLERMADHMRGGTW